MKINSSLAKFGITGVAATSIHVITVSILIPIFRVDVGISNGIAFVLATMFSSFVNTRWSFRSQLSYRTIVRFWIVAIFGCFVTVVLAKIAENMGLHYLVGVIIVATVVPVISYVLHQHYTYR